MYLADGDDLVIVASKGGRPTNPAWWLNLRESPSTTVRVGGEERAVVARQATPEEKEQLWPRLVELYPTYDEYRERTDRDIPVVILRPDAA
jgi:F420H(2)-dependent quinone reductase